MSPTIESQSGIFGIIEENLGYLKELVGGTIEELYDIKLRIIKQDDELRTKDTQIALLQIQKSVIIQYNSQEIRIAYLAGIITAGIAFFFFQSLNQ